jgi:hypothetical protein
MNFGYVFRYLAKLCTGEVVVWRVLAENRKEADTKVNTYLEGCSNSGYFNVPIKVEFASKEDNLILY